VTTKQKPPNTLDAFRTFLNDRQAELAAKMQTAMLAGNARAEEKFSLRLTEVDYLIHQLDELDQ